MISIIIPTSRHHSFIKEILTFLDEEVPHLRKKIEVIIVKDGIDSKLEWENLSFNNFTLHVFYQNHKGPAAARNLGIRKVKGDIICFLDDDSLPQKCISFSFKELILPYSEISSPLKEACNFLEKNLENINIRYVPFCFFLGYEKYICGHFQVLYDPFEWDPYVRVRLEKHYPPFAWIFMIGYGAFKKRDFSLIKEKKYREFLNQCIVTSIRVYGYAKAKKCKECRYFYLCDGVEKSYAKKMGLDELKPVKGERIKEYHYFRKHLFKI